MNNLKSLCIKRIAELGGSSILSHQFCTLKVLKQLAAQREAFDLQGTDIIEYLSANPNLSPQDVQDLQCWDPWFGNNEKMIELAEAFGWQYPLSDPDDREGLGQKMHPKYEQLVKMKTKTWKDVIKMIDQVYGVRLSGSQKLSKQEIAMKVMQIIKADNCAKLIPDYHQLMNIVQIITFDYHYGLIGTMMIESEDFDAEFLASSEPFNSIMQGKYYHLPYCKKLTFLDYVRRGWKIPCQVWQH
jgi:hypothetical protein